VLKARAAAVRVCDEVHKRERERALASERAPACARESEKD
jgi:hypothetical protein